MLRFPLRVTCYRLAFTLAILLLIFQSARAGQIENQCQKQHANEKKQGREEIEKLRKSIPNSLVGPMVVSGACTLRALRLGITFGTRKDFSNAVQIANAMDCINIRLYEIDQQCKCEELGLAYDAGAEDEIFNEYAKIRKLEKRLLSVGIPNAAIRSYVKNLSATKDCISRASIKLLKDIHTKLEGVNIPNN